MNEDGGSYEKRLVCHSILQQRENRHIKLVAHVTHVRRLGKPCLTISTPAPASVAARSFKNMGHSSRTCSTSWTLSRAHTQCGESFSPNYRIGTLLSEVSSTRETRSRTAAGQRSDGSAGGRLRRLDGAGLHNPHQKAKLRRAGRLPLTSASLATSTACRSSAVRSRTPWS